MAILDKILLWGFIGIGVLSLTWSGFAFYRAIKAAEYKDDGFKMFLWAAGGLLGLVIAGMSTAYILLPIILHYSGE